MSALETAATRLREAGVESPQSEARRLLALAMGVSQEDVISGRVVPEVEALARFESAVARRTAREPFAYIARRREFFSLEFEVEPGVLIPRPESEVMVEEALRHFPQSERRLHVLDLGTGSGCLVLAFLIERQGAQGLGIDTSEVALACARRNAERHGLGGRVSFLRDDWGESLVGDFDVILANPPYVKSSEIVTLAPEIAFHEPASALDGGPDGLEAYRRIAPAIARLLSTTGRAFVEIGEGQAEAVSSILKESNLSVSGTVTDFARIHRCLVIMVAAEQQFRPKQKKQL